MEDCRVYRVDAGGGHDDESEEARGELCFHGPKTLEPHSFGFLTTTSPTLVYRISLSLGLRVLYRVDAGGGHDDESEEARGEPAHDEPLAPAFPFTVR